MTHQDKLFIGGEFVTLASSIVLGDPLAPRTEMGPLTSPEHRDRVLSYVKIAQDEGGEILTGGTVPDDPALASGCYIEPTVVRAQPTDRVCQEEVFGPFCTVGTFADDDEALELVNGTDYGLGGGLWTNDLRRAHRMAAGFRSGMVWINSYKRVNPGSPFGGVGKSGYGREMGFEAMHDYTEAKSVWVDVDARIPPGTRGERHERRRPRWGRGPSLRRRPGRRAPGRESEEVPAVSVTNVDGRAGAGAPACGGGRAGGRPAGKAKRYPR